MKKILTTLTLLLGGMLFLVTTHTFATPITKISFATEATYPPFEYVTRDGEIVGFDIDIAKAICKKLNAQCKFSNQPFDSLIPSLKLGKFDALIAALAITDQRKKHVAFSNPYYQNSGSFLTHKNSTMTLTPEGISGKTVGVQSGTTFSDYLKAKYGKRVKIQYYASEESAFLDLASNRIDAVLGDTPIILQWLQKHGKDNYKIVGKPIVDKKYLGEGYGIAVKKNNTALLNAINKALAAIKSDGTYNKIESKHFGK